MHVAAKLLTATLLSVHVVGKVGSIPQTVMKGCGLSYSSFFYRLCAGVRGDLLHATLSECDLQ